jgi:predicted nucleic acid-binding protein
MSDRDVLQFVDTNILVYAYDRSEGEKQARAKALVKELWNRHNGCLSIQVLQEFLVNITRKVAQPVDLGLASQIVQDLSTWRVHIPDVADVLGAIRIQQEYQLSFWDAMVVRSAVQSDCQVIWSEDLSDGQTIEGIRMTNPFLNREGTRL